MSKKNKRIDVVAQGSKKFCNFFPFKFYLKTLRTLIVAGELITESLRFLAASISGGSSLGFDDADVAKEEKSSKGKKIKNSKITLTQIT
jgi:hypothetical protein